VKTASATSLKRWLTSQDKYDRGKLAISAVA
jgi:hypothetical protein